MREIIVEFEGRLRITFPDPPEPPTRLTESGETRITESGNARILETV